MDEPTASLNQTETDRLLGLINNIKLSGIGVIYISHRLGEVFKIADRISVLRDGEKIDTHNTSDIDENKLILQMVGKRGNVFYTREAGIPEEVVLQVRGYRIREDTQEIDFSLRRGEILGVAGMVGSGRSELMKGLFGAEALLRGSLSLNDITYKILNPRDAIDAGICLVPEDRQIEGLVLCRSVRENTTLPGLKKFNGFSVSIRLQPNR